MAKSRTDKCDKCGKVLHLDQKPWPWCPHESTIPVDASRLANPIIYYTNSKGETWFPGHKDDKAPKGYEQHRITNMQEYNKFAREQSDRGLRESQRQVENEDRVWAPIEAKNRRELQAQMSSMGEFERAYAQAAIDYNNSKPKERGQSSGFHNLAMEYNQSNAKYQGEDS